MGAVASLVFGTRNFGKSLNGDTTRGVVAGEQMISVLDSISKSGTYKGVEKVLETADGAVDSIFKACKKTEVLDDMVKSTGAASKVGAIAQKAVNPLLCVAAGARVLKDDDQYAALIEESSAMAAMFGMESLMKVARHVTTGEPEVLTGLAAKAKNLLGKSETITKLGKTASDWFTKLGTGANGSAKQKVAKIGIDLLFVAGSILAYNLGHKAGEALSGRNKDKEKV